MSPIGWTVLGGYLGAGKTTLLNDLLARAGPDERVAVVVNDFGAVNVDAALVRSRSADTLELANGCVCCSARDGMAAVLDRLRALDPPPARVLVEVSGVGDPAAVAAWGDHPGFARRGVVVCADAVDVRTLARDRWVADTVLAQLARADVVLLTKLDLTDPGEHRPVRDWVAAAAPLARVSEHREAVLDLLRGDPVRRPGPPAAESDAHADTHTAWSVPVTGPLRRDALDRALAALPAQVARVKGVVELVDSPGRRTVVHVVAGRREIRDDGPLDDGFHGTGLVVVTRGAPGTHDGDAAVVRRLRRDLAVS